MTGRAVLAAGLLVLAYRVGFKAGQRESDAYFRFTRVV